jgi:hypothetical protein
MLNQTYISTKGFCLSVEYIFRKNCYFSAFFIKLVLEVENLSRRRLKNISAGRLDKDLIATIVMNIDKRATTDQKSGNITVAYESESDFKVVNIGIQPVQPNFGLNLDILSIPPPLEFGFKIYWDLDNTRLQCSNLGCPLLDPRTIKRQPENKKLHVNIQSGN